MYTLAEYFFVNRSIPREILDRDISDTLGEKLERFPSMAVVELENREPIGELSVSYYEQLRKTNQQFSHMIERFNRWDAENQNRTLCTCGRSYCNSFNGSFGKIELNQYCKELIRRMDRLVNELFGVAEEEELTVEVWHSICPDSFLKEVARNLEFVALRALEKVNTDQSTQGLIELLSEIKRYSFIQLELGPYHSDRTKYLDQFRTRIHNLSVYKWNMKENKILKEIRSIFPEDRGQTQ